MTTGSVLAQFTITLSQAVSEQVAVEWHTADGTALAGVDYAAAKGTVLFAPGQTAKTVDILVHGRAVGSEDRSFFVEMLPPTNAILGASIGECIIHVDTTGSTPVTQIIVPTGPQGLQGDSAYQAWLDLGNTGTEEDFINSLKPSAEEIAEEVAPILNVSNSPLTAEGTETLSKPDTMTGKRLARRVAYVGAAKVATAVLADGDNLITHADLSGDAVDFNSISLYPRILRGTVVISPEWSVEPGDKILIKSAAAGDVLHVCQYNVISERAVKNVVEPLVSAALAPVRSQAFEALRRSYAEMGYNVVGTFRGGFTIVNANDVGIDETTGKGFTGPAGPVAAGTDPASGGFVDRSGALLASKLRTHLAYFMAFPNVASEANTAALEAAFNSGVPLYGTGKYIATRPIVLSNKFDFDSMSGVGGVKFYVNGDFEFFKIDESAQFKTQESNLKGFEFGSDVDGSGYGVKSREWAPAWTVSDGVFKPTLRTAWDAPIILAEFNNVLFTENGEHPVVIFDGTGLPPNRIQNANYFNRVRFRSKFDRLSNASNSIVFRLGAQNVWRDCEFGLRGGQSGTIEVGAAANMHFSKGCWIEGPRSPYFVDCTNAGGFRPLQINFDGAHLAPHTGMFAWVGTLAEDGGDYDTMCTFANCDEEATGVTTVQLTRNKVTGEYNSIRALPYVGMNWFYYQKSPIGGVIEIPLTRGSYTDKIKTRDLSVKTNGQFPLISISGNTAERWLISCSTAASIITMRSDTNAALNYQMDPTAHYPGSDNARSSGKANLRWSAVYAGTGAISTSDARMKTSVRKMSDAEVNVGLEIADEIGFYKWLAEIEKKGDDARLHSGVTVQRVIEIFEKHGLDPFEYGAVCYDKWDEYTEHVPETLDENGNVLAEEHTIHHPAGDIYSLRNDEIHYLMMGAMREQQRMMEARISRLERQA